MGRIFSWSFTTHAARGKHAMPERRVKLVLHPPRLNREPRVALLIDAENISPETARLGMSVAHELGRVTVSRAYGNAGLLRSNVWKRTLDSFGVEPIACFGYVAGKNSSDIRLVVDAMRLLFGDNADVFVVVSNDSDFIPLAREIRAAGKVVQGVGNGPVSEAYRLACDGFHIAGPSLEARRGHEPKKRKARAGKAVDEQIVLITRDCMNRISPGGGWCDIGLLCNQLNKQLHGFSPKDYGCKNMASFARETGILEVKSTDRGRRVRLIAA